MKPSYVQTSGPFKGETVYYCRQCEWRFRGFSPVCIHCGVSVFTTFARWEIAEALRLRNAPAENDAALNGEWHSVLAGMTITVSRGSTWEKRKLTRGNDSFEVSNLDVRHMIESRLLERIP